MYDIIGDIHGHAQVLRELLEKLGYRLSGGSYKHPDNRKIIFAGDYIDRGPEIRETLQIVKSMTDSKSAFAVLGNHEYNAICFHTPDGQGGYLRQHTEKNIMQHSETIKQFENLRAELYFYLEWMKSLPLFLEINGLRIVHAGWIKNDIQYVRQNLSNNRLTDYFLHRSTMRGSSEYLALEHLLKGIEIDIPENCRCYDSDGVLREKLRIKWWEDPHNATYKSLAVHEHYCNVEIPVPISQIPISLKYKAHEKPVFFGHYWKKGTPEIQAENVCCVDYSVAKGEKLVAYRWDGELKLDNSKFDFVKAS